MIDVRTRRWLRVAAITSSLWGLSACGVVGIHSVTPSTAPHTTADATACSNAHVVAEEITAKRTPTAAELGGIINSGVVADDSGVRSAADDMRQSAATQNESTFNPAFISLQKACGRLGLWPNWPGSSGGT